MELPFPSSICHECHYRRVVGNRRGSVFLQCTAPNLAKYSPQPVMTCPSFRERSAADNEEDLGRGR